MRHFPFHNRLTIIPSFHFYTISVELDLDDNRLSGYTLESTLTPNTRLPLSILQLESAYTRRQSSGKDEKTKNQWPSGEYLGVEFSNKQEQLKLLFRWYLTYKFHIIFQIIRFLEMYLYVDLVHFCWAKRLQQPDKHSTQQILCFMTQKFPKIHCGI